MGEVASGSAISSGLRRWSNDLSIGLVADIIIYGQTLDDVRRRLYRNSLEELLAVRPTAIDRGFRLAPLATLRSLSDEQLAEELPNGVDISRSAAAAIDWLTESRKGFSSSPLAAARMLSHLCMDRTADSNAIRRAGSALFGEAWPTSRSRESQRQDVELSLAAFRGLGGARGRGTLDRLSGLADFASAMLGSDEVWSWALVENAIFRQIFAWPLLVDNTSTEPAYEAVAIPVAVDVYFDGRGDVDTDFGGTLDTAVRISWDNELRRAVQAAKVLWASKHGRAPRHFKNEIEAASVVFDFRIADKVLQQTPAGLDVRDGSMVPYFAQFVLHRLLGHTQAFTAVVTGELGPRARDAMTNRELLDYDFESAGFIERKLRYAFRTQEFSKVIVSERQSPEERAFAYRHASNDNSLTEVNYCRRLSNVADAVQPGRWRREDYIRCPDLLRVLSNDTDELLPSSDPSVLEVGRLLSENRDSVLQIPEGVSALTLASYLHYTNWTAREAIATSGDESSIRANTRRVPPALSWTFLRCVEDVNDRRLWRLVWDSIGAPEEDFLRFQHANNRDAAAFRLAEALNTFSPSQGALSHRAPDLLVFLDVRHLAASNHKADAAAYRTHVFSPMIDALRTKLLPTPIEPMRQFIGNTRIILLQEGRTEVSGDMRLRGLLTEHRSYDKIVGLLTTFRFGFSIKMASSFLSRLGHDYPKIRSLFDNLVASGDLKVVGGKYWVAGQLGGSGLRDSDSLESAKRHFACALAYLPHLSRQFVPTLEAADTFCVEHIQEANLHLEIAGSIASNVIQRIKAANNKTARTEIQVVRSQVRVAQASLLQLFEVAGPGVVEDLNRDREGIPLPAVWTLVQDLLEEKDRLVAAGVREAKCSPNELTIYAETGAKLLAAIRKNGKKPTEGDRIRKKVLQYFDTALDRASAWKLPENLLLSLLSRYGYFLVMHGDREPDHKYGLKWTQKRTQDLVQLGIRSSSVQAKWFEVEGDRCQDHVQAAMYYRAGNEMAPLYWPCIIKLLGVDASKQSIAGAVRVVAKEQRLSRIEEWARAQPFPIRSGLDQSWIRDRWNRGIEALAQHAHKDDKSGQARAPQS